jgi:hypothetical protein
MLANIDIGYNLVPLDKVDLSLVSVLYTQGDFAAVTPVYSYIDDLGEGAAAAAGAGADGALSRECVWGCVGECRCSYWVWVSLLVAADCVHGGKEAVGG